MDSDSTDFSTQQFSLLEFVPAAGAPRFPCPPALRDRLLIDTVHDGRFIPEEFLVDGAGMPIPTEVFQAHYEMERDWGANMVAHYLASALGLAGHWQINIARVLMDYGRFPGVTGRKADHLHRYAINYPFSALLGFSQKRRLLEHYYDTISHKTDRAVRDKLIKIAIHTYDQYNDSGTLRPDVSIVSRSIGYQTASELPVGVFDPLYPAELLEFTADRVLLSRMSLVLEKGGIPVAHNYPYCLPEGSIEVRAQVWFFFNWLRRRFFETYSELEGAPGYKLVFDMLMDTNLRSTKSEALRSYLHMFRKPPEGRVRLFNAAREAYEAVRDFVNANSALIKEYRFSADRPSSLGIEVRKDLVWEFDHGRPVRPKPDAARRIAEVIAEALFVYLDHDRSEKALEPMVVPRGPWYTPQDS